MDQIFRCWVELRDLRDDTTRVLPITAFRRVLLLTKRKATAEPAPDQLVLRVQDVGRVWEAPDMEELARQLREHYPDKDFVRTLKCERDLSAEEMRRSAIEELARIIAHAAIRQLTEARAQRPE